MLPTDSSCLLYGRKYNDPVRVQASFIPIEKSEGNALPEFRKFSVDPQITTFDTLRSLISRAFDIQSEFLISYRTEDFSGKETYLSLLSDFDLEAAFLGSSDPYLYLRIDPIPLEVNAEEWDLVTSGESPLPMQEPFRSNSLSLQTKILSSMEKTFSLMQQALSLNGSNGMDGTSSAVPPLNDSEFREYRDGVGRLVRTHELKQRIFQGGLEPSLRRVVWKHLLNVYPDGMTGAERMEYIKAKVDEYDRLKNAWLVHSDKNQLAPEFQAISCMVTKDVLRTDRHHPFYGGPDDNPNVVSLHRLLTTYAFYHPSVTYCQGMSDLASPLLFVMGNEAHAYIAFAALMERLQTNFSVTGEAMTLKFHHLSQAIAYYDPQFFHYLQEQQATDLLFCYRWLLLEMKREFAFDDSLRMLEVSWSSLTTKVRRGDLPLFEISNPQFNVPTKPIPCPLPKETVYSKLVAVRRQESLGSLGSRTSSQATPSFDHSKSHQEFFGSENFVGNLSSVFSGDREIEDATSSVTLLDNNAILEDSLHDNCEEKLTTSSSDKLPSGTEEPTDEEINSVDLDGVACLFDSDQNVEKSFEMIESPQGEEEEEQLDYQPKPRVPLTNRIAKQLSLVFVPGRKRHDTKTSGKESALGSLGSSVDMDPGRRSRSATVSSTACKSDTNENSRRRDDTNGSSPRSRAENVAAVTDSGLHEVELLGSCEEATETTFQDRNCVPGIPLPPPETFGNGNPFLMFLCLAVILQHRTHIMERRMDHNELAMHFDRMVRKHNVERVLSHARALYLKYLRQFGISSVHSPKKNVNI